MNNIITNPTQKEFNEAMDVVKDYLRINKIQFIAFDAEKNAIVAAIGFEDAMNNKKEIFGDRYIGMFDKKLEEKRMRTNLEKIFRPIAKQVSKYGPEIAVGVGIAGMITTTVLAVKATPKALKLIDEAKKEKQKKQSNLNLQKWSRLHGNHMFQR